MKINPRKNNNWIYIRKDLCHSNRFVCLRWALFLVCCQKKQAQLAPNSLLFLEARRDSLNKFHDKLSPSTYVSLRNESSERDCPCKSLDIRRLSPLERGRHRCPTLRQRWSLCFRWLSWRQTDWILRCFVLNRLVREPNSRSNSATTYSCRSSAVCHVTCLMAHSGNEVSSDKDFIQLTNWILKIKYLQRMLLRVHKLKRLS